MKHNKVRFHIESSLSHWISQLFSDWLSINLKMGPSSNIGICRFINFMKVFMSSYHHIVALLKEILVTESKLTAPLLNHCKCPNLLKCAQFIITLECTKKIIVNSKAFPQLSQLPKISSMTLELHLI